MIYDKTLDELMYRLLLEQNKIHFNKLLKQLNEKFRSTTRRRLSIHLKKNEEEGIIERDELSHGNRRNIWLSEEARVQIKLGIFEGIKSKRESKSIKKEETKEQQLKKLICVMLVSGVSGTRYFKKSDRPKPGQLVLKSKEGKEVHYQFETKKGIGVDDFSLPIRHGITYGALRDIEIDKDELRKCFQLVCDLYPQIFRSVGFENEKIRYGIIDTQLHDYIQESELMLSSTISRMENTWWYRKPIRKTGEVMWYRSLFGKARTTKFFLEAEEHRKKMEKRDRIEQTIRFFDDDIQEWLNLLQSKKYQSTQKMYSLFCRLVKDISYPKFLKELNEKGQF